MDSKKVAFITGATSGIGKATAERLYNLGFALIITGRREERLKQWSEGKENILCLKFDVRNEEEVNAAISSLNGKWKNIDVLVNNAGLAMGLSRY